MKSHFIKLFDYDQFANQLILKSIFAAGEPEFAVKLMAHSLAAQQVWVNRCKKLPARSVTLWPDGKAATFEKMINNNHDAWIDFINGLQPEDFDKVIAYKNTLGEDFENILSDILTHVINHGTHHRAQAGQHLKLYTTEKLPITDYIFYLRQI